MLTEPQKVALLCAIADLIGAIECSKEFRWGYDGKAAEASIDDLLQEFPDLDLPMELEEAFNKAVNS